MIISTRLLIALSLALPCAVVAKEIKRTHKLQVIVSPEDPTYFAGLNNNNGEGLQQNLGIREKGAEFTTFNGYILEGGTVGKRQSSYLVNKKGQPINFEKDSIGYSYLAEIMVETLDFINSIFPEPGSLVELSDWQLHFNRDCGSTPNVILAKGFATISNFTIGEGKSVFTFNMVINGGFGCNQNTQGTSFTGKVYIAENGQSSLIKLKFQNPIEYKA